MNYPTRLRRRNLVPTLISALCLTGDALAQFAPPVSYPAGNTPVAIATGDFNGDGQLDAAIANQDSNTIVVLLGNGTGGFAQAPAGALATGISPNLIAAGDF